MNDFVRSLFILIILLVDGLLWSYPPLPEPRNEEERLLIRRIVECWRDKEYTFAQAQIKGYLKNHPDTLYSDYFWAMLGDMSLQNTMFSEALGYYENIKSEELKKYVELKKWQTLYHMGRYAQLYEEIAPHSAHLDEEGRFYYAEAAFREAFAVLRYPEGEEVAKALYEQALPIYASLLENPLFSSHAKLSIAEIHRVLNRPEKAAELYMEIAEEEKNNDVLFHAATALLQCDKQKAGHIFKKIALERCEKSPEAAYQWLLLLAEKEEWETLAHERDLFSSCLEKERLPVCYFYLGMLSFEKKLYTQATIDLQKCIGHNLPPQHEKKALLTLLQSARELEKWELCETCYEELQTKYPEAKAEGCCMLASAYQKVGQNARALRLFEQVIQEFPHTECAEKASVEKIRLFMAQEKFGEAHNVVLSFLNEFPHSQKKIEMYRLAIDLSLSQLAQDEVYSQLVADIERGLQAKIFYKEEKIEKELLLAKGYLKLGKVHDALQVLHNCERPDPLVLAYCYIKEGTSPENVIHYGEKALLEYPNEDKLHICLFNAYLELSKEDHHEKEHTRKAAHHLNAVIDTYQVSLENRLWLAHYFSKEETERAIPILESITETESNIKRFDQEAFLLATLYLDNNLPDKAELLLEKLVSLQQKTEQDAKLKLAELYIKKGDKQRAKALLNKLEESAQNSIAYSARLHLARLDFDAFPEKSLKKLQELAVRKSIAHEPIHLEAAIDYADLKALSYPEEEHSQQLLQLLLETKDAFTNQDDIWSKDYHASRELNPEKDLIYQAYMRYIDARIYLLQAKLCEDPVDGKTKLNAARALFSTLRHGKYAVSQYIKEKSTSKAYGD